MLLNDIMDLIGEGLGACTQLLCLCEGREKVGRGGRGKEDGEGHVGEEREGREGRGGRKMERGVETVQCMRGKKQVWTA